jgi:hypothetical protein
MFSKRVAGTPELADWVRSHYCARLQAAWKVLTDGQRTALKFDDHGGLDGSTISLRADSYEKEVRPYCGV